MSQKFMTPDVPIPNSSFAPGNQQYYVLRMAPTNGYLNIYFTQGPLASGSPTDPPIEMSVWQDTVISVELDTAWQWQFIQGSGANPVTLCSKDETDRYFNLVPVLNSNDICTQVTFDARYYSEGAQGNQDSFNLFVLLDQQVTGGSFPLQIPVKIDPTVDNPGDPPGNG